MAILQGSVPVNSGNSGWTHAHVIDALETVFADLQMHGGTAKNGVPVGVASPNNKVVGYDSSYWTDWKHVGGRLNHFDKDYRYFNVLANGTTSYKMLEYWTITDINSSNNATWGGSGELYLNYNRQLKTGEAVVWCPDSTATADDNIAGLQLNTTYYVIRRTINYVQLALSEADALAGTAIDLSASTAPVNGWTDKSVLRRPDIAGNENKQIDVWQYDNLIFKLDASLPGNFKICSGTSYAANMELKYDNRDNLPWPINGGTSTDNNYPMNLQTGAAGTDLTWDTEGVRQSEDEVIDLKFDSTAPTVKDSNGNPYVVGSESIPNNKINQFCYVNDTHASMKGVINVVPSFSYYNDINYSQYWKVTIPGTDVGLTSPAGDLKLRFYRWHGETNNSYRGYLNNCLVCNTPEGWSDNAVFTVPADSIQTSLNDPNALIPSEVNFDGGAVDIVFGVNTANTTDGAYDGKPNILTTNFGTTSSFYQKSADGYHAILKLVHDSNKNFGTTYWAFSMPSANNGETNYDLIMKAGIYWDPMNTPGTKISENGSSQTSMVPGYWRGEVGLDYQNSYTSVAKYSNGGSYSHISHVQIATNSSSNSYPLEIRYYKAQAQDTNFAIIQFIQSINSIPNTWGTFYIPRGTSFGNPNPGMDLDHLFHGSLFDFQDNGVGIDVVGSIPGYYRSYYGSESPATEPWDDDSMTRDSIYGYIRNTTGNSGSSITRFPCNIDVSNSTGSDWKFYYRNSTYDKTDSAVDYYRPIKGIPLMGNFVPCPYYLPDDFVLIQVGTAPGLTAFRSGDTITVSGSEKYVIIMAAVNQSQTGLNKLTGDTVEGMLLCGRIPN